MAESKMAPYDTRPIHPVSLRFRSQSQTERSNQQLMDIVDIAWDSGVQLMLPFISAGKSIKFSVQSDQASFIQFLPRVHSMLGVQDCATDDSNKKGGVELTALKDQQNRIITDVIITISFLPFSSCTDYRLCETLLLKTGH